MSDTKSEASVYGWQDFKGTINEWAWWWLEFHFLHHAKANDDIETEEFCRQLMITKAKHARVLQMLEIAEAELKDARDFAMDTLARANQAIETDCDKCDYQCQGCIRAIDDAEAVKYNISIALEKIKSLK